jgi:hypothetical protein
MSYEDQPMDQEEVEGLEPARSRAAEKVKLPAIFLIIVGVLNALAGLWSAGQGVVQLVTKNTGAQELKEQVKKETQLTAQQKQMMEGWADTAQKVGPAGNIVIGLIELLAAAVTVFGGVRMLSLQSYGLAVTGSILAAIPVVSFLGCCCIGEGVGIWSLIVLMSADVKTAFR